MSATRNSLSHFLEDPKAPQHRITRFRAHIYFPPEQIYVSQAEGIFCGVRISATGQLIKRERLQAFARSIEGRMATARLISATHCGELETFHFPGRSAIAGEVYRRPRATGEAHVEATLHGDRIQRGAYEMRNFSANAEWIDQTSISRNVNGGRGRQFRGPGQLERERAWRISSFTARSI